MQLTLYVQIKFWTGASDAGAPPVDDNYLMLFGVGS